MGALAWMLTGLLTRSAWLLGPERTEWLEGLLAEAAEARANRVRVAWLLGGVRFLAGELLRRSAIRIVTFLAASGLVLWIVWPGTASDRAVPVNRIVVPALLALLALLPLLVRRFYGPIRQGLLPRMVRVAGYLIVLAIVAGHAVQERAGEKLGAYFTSGAGMPMSVLAALFALVLAGYAAAILILTSRRARLSRSVLPIGLGLGTLAAVAGYAHFTVHLWSGARGMLLDRPWWGWWGCVALGLPLLTGFAVARHAARDAPGNGMLPARQGGVAAVCATGTSALLLAALIAVTVAITPQRVPLHTPPPPAGGGCETCGPAGPTIPPDLRHEYWVGLSISQAARGPDWMLAITPIFALFAGALGAGLAEASRHIGSPVPAPASEG